MAATTVALTRDEQSMLDGAHGDGVAMAMQVIVKLAEVADAPGLIPVSGAHIDGCLYHGDAGLDFAERLASMGARVAVPTTLNVSALDLLHPELIRLSDATRAKARRLMDAYVEMGCQPTWTCAPYQLPDRPKRGEHIAWAESNAIVFANSVLGARTGRYGDFTDICAAVTGRVPDLGFHRDENRRAEVVFTIDWLPVGDQLADEVYGLIGHVLGREAGSLVPAVVGLPAETTEDQLKAVSAAAASSGSVAMFHAVGITPEAPTLEAALGGAPPRAQRELTREMLRRAWAELSTTDGVTGRLHAVSVGTPHFSPEQVGQLVRLLDGRRVAAGVEMYASTGRATLAALEAQGNADALAAAGIQVVVDTCTYITPILRAARGSTVMTDSAKWAWYAPANLGMDVVYGSLVDCVELAVIGRVIRRVPAILED